MSVSSERITSNTSYYIIALTTQKILAFVYFILIARFLGAEDIGRYALAVSFIQILSIFIDLGTSPAITREASRNTQIIPEQFSRIIGFKVVMSIIAACILVALSFLFGYTPLIRSLLYLAAIVMILDSFTLTFYAMLRGLHVLKSESVGTVVYQAFVIIISLVGLYNGADVKVLLVALIVASLFNFGWSLLHLRMTLPFPFSITFKLKDIKPFIMVALPFGITALFIKLYQTGDTVLLSLLSNETELGLYSVAHKLVFAFEFIPLAFMASIFPAMSSFYKSNKEQMFATFEAASFYLLYISLPILLGGFVLAKQLIVALYGREFLPAAESLQILLLSLVFIFLNYPLSSLLGASNRQTINMYFMGGAALVSIVFNILLIPKFGGTGSSFALLFSLTLLFITYNWYIHNSLDYRMTAYFSMFKRVGVVALLMTLVVTIISPYVVWWAVLIIGAATYIGLSLATKLIDMNDIKHVIKSVRRV